MYMYSIIYKCGNTLSISINIEILCIEHFLYTFCAHFLALLLKVGTCMHTFKHKTQNDASLGFLITFMCTFP